MSQQCGSRHVRDRAEVVGQLAGPPGKRDLSDDEFDKAVEQRGLESDRMVTSTTAPPSYAVDMDEDDRQALETVRDVISKVISRPG